jgi:hypothetical protein
MNTLEVRVLEVTPAVVKFNFDEMSQFAKALAEEYKGLTFDEETVKEGKKTVAELKKIQKSVNDFKVATKKDLTASVTLFETQCKNIIAEFDEPINFISSQLDTFEAERIRIKTLIANKLIQDFYEAQGVEPKFQTVVFRPDWLNVTKKEKEIALDISYDVKECLAKQEQYYLNCKLVETYIKLANSEYQLGVSIDPKQFVKMLDYKTISEVKETIEYQAQIQQEIEIDYKAKVAQQAERAAMVKVAEVVEQVNDFIPVEATQEEPKLNTTIRIRGTKAQFDALKKYLQASGIEVLA